MNNNFKAEAINVVQHQKKSMDYFSKFGNNFVKVIAKVFLEAVEMK
jgi:hypothetical protein